MTIRKIDELNFEHEFAAGEDNDEHGLSFTNEGLEIYYDTLAWEDIKAAYKKIFDSDLDT